MLPDPLVLLQLNDALSLGQHRVWKRMAVKWCGASTGQTVLDVCCGSGDLAFRLAEAVGPTGEVMFSQSCKHNRPWPHVFCILLYTFTYPAGCH